MAVVLPSECYENCPLTVINSLWYGTPVIASRTGGVPDFVPADAGWLFEPGNADELAEKLQWVIGNKDQVLALRPKAQQWAQQQFEPETNYTHLLDIYKKAHHAFPMIDYDISSSYVCIKNSTVFMYTRKLCSSCLYPLLLKAEL